MIRPWVSLVVLLAGACSGGPAPMHAIPNWTGPVVHVRQRGDRGLEVELTAPTAGHTFALQDVQRSAERTDLHFVHREPGSNFVAQVVTPLCVSVSPEQLGDARAVFVWIATATHPLLEPSSERLAIALARP